jgi:hypothetical protein
VSDAGTDTCADAKAVTVADARSDACTNADAQVVFAHAAAVRSTVDVAAVNDAIAVHGSSVTVTATAICDAAAYRSNVTAVNDAVAILGSSNITVFDAVAKNVSAVTGWRDTFALTAAHFSGHVSSVTGGDISACAVHFSADPFAFAADMPDYH